MKYGDTLQQRSIPVWENYNVDYNDIKRLIKANTTKSQAEAIAIPGKCNEAKALQKFEDELYAELREQHQRVDLFVQCKAGEITRRLLHLDKQVVQLEKRNLYSNHHKIPVRRLEKFSKAEEAILKAGEEIQSLARFVGAQRLAFQKLLKKYKKWTGSSELGKRFHKEVFGRQTGFARRDFRPLLTQWSEVLAAVRAPFEAEVEWEEGFLPQNDDRESTVENLTLFHSRTKNRSLRLAKSDEGVPTSAAQIHSACEEGSSIDVDTTLAILPLGRRAGKASYWIHPENLIEIQILLLQHTRLWIPVTSPASTGTPSSTKSSRRNSINGRGSGLGRIPEDEIGVMICDDLERFAKRRSAATIGDSENVPGNTTEKAAASIRYAPKGDAVVVVRTSPDVLDASTPTANRGVRKARFKRKALRDLFDLSSNLSPAQIQARPSKLNYTADLNDVESVQSVSTWFTQHREVQPLVQIQLKRSRFVGLGNSESGGVWGTLDKDVSMRQCSSKIACGNEDFLTFGKGNAASTAFPHAVLEVRYEGEGNAKLVTALDESHLTERVRGFSLETHAVATLCHPHGMPRPFWLPALKNDIRKIPVQGKPPHRRSSDNQLSPDGTNTRHTSTSGEGQSSSVFSAQRAESSATSAPELLESPSLSALKKKRKSRSRAEHPLRRQLSGPSIPQYQRYWNEFDNGDECSENEAYTIFVDPNAPSRVPGAAALSKAIEFLAAGVNASTKRVKLCLGLPKSKPSTPNERQPLIDGEYINSQASAEADTDLDDDISPTRTFRRRHYSTISLTSTAPTVRALESRDRLLSRSCIASFIASFAILFLAFIIATTGRKRDAATVGLGVIGGVIASLVFATAAVGTMIGRTEDVGWMYRVGVLLGFTLDCVGCGFLFVELGSV